MLFFFCLLIQTCIYHYRGKFAMESKKSCRCKIIWESPESSYPFLWQTSVYICISYPHLCHRMQGCSWEYKIFQLTFNQECEEHIDFPVIEFSTLRKFLFFFKNSFNAWLILESHLPFCCKECCAFWLIISASDVRIAIVCSCWQFMN